MKKSAIVLAVALGVFAVVFTGCIGNVEVPDLTKSTIENAKMSLDKRNLLIYVVDKVPSDDVDEGLICKQDPLALSDVKRGSTVKVWISTGPNKVEIPRVDNANLNDVLRSIAVLGLYSNVEFVYSDEVAKDMVISVDPAPGTKVDKDTYVKIKVSMGSEPVKTVEVPKVTGMGKASAESKLKEAGLEAKFVYRVSTEYYEGTLYYQTPKAGSVVPKGSAVTVYIASVLD
ncbi:PASTA domain-containing protein [bacterium]|nr:PASTA domain-containing protein [bacterium]